MGVDQKTKPKLHLYLRLTSGKKYDLILTKAIIGTMTDKARAGFFDLWAVASKEELNEDDIRRLSVGHIPA